MAKESYQRSREAEKLHVQKIGHTEWLRSKPFLARNGLDVDRALTEIQVFAALVENLPFGPGARILDVGAGPCWVSEWLQKLGYATISCDLAHDMLRVGQGRLRPGSSLVAGDMAALPLADASVDGVVCYGALHHVPNWPEAVAEFHRVLRPHGVLVLQEPGRGHAQQAESIAQMEQFGVLEQDLPPRTLRRACLDVGFSNAWIRPLNGTLGHGRLRIMPAYPFLRAAPRLFLKKRLSRWRCAVLEHGLNMLAPMHLVVAAKGVIWADSLRPETMVARFQRVELPVVVPPDQTFSVELELLNTGLTRWRAETIRDGMGHVRVGVSCLHASDGTLKDLDYARIALPRDLPPGERLKLAARLPGLPAGEWILRFDLVAEGLFWFANKGSRTVSRTIIVTTDAPPV